LRRIGLPSEIAGDLAARLAKEEQNVGAVRLAQLAGFEGVVPMDAGPLDVKVATQ
jgi:hypothetical protein